MNKIENNMYYQTNIKTSRNKDINFLQLSYGNFVSLDDYILLKKENQQLKEKQKEFIEWLNNIVNNLEKEQIKRFNHSYQYKLNSFNDILSKYKEIIGVDNEMYREIEKIKSEATNANTTN